MIGAHHSPAAQNVSRRRILAAVRWIAAFAVLGVLFYFLPLSTLRESLARVPVTRFLAILIGYLLAHCVGIVKWRLIVNTAGAKLDFATSAQCYLGGLFATLFLPSIVGGDIVRLAVGLRRSPRPAAVLAGNIADRFIDVLAQAGLVLLGVLLLPGSVTPQLQTRVRNAVLLLVAIGIVLLALAVLLRRALLANRSVRFRRRLARLRHALRSVARQPQRLILGWALGTMIQSALLMLTALLAISCGLFEPLRVWLFAWPLAKLAAILPLTQGGIGVREAALVALLTPFGAPGSLVLASGLAWEGIILAGGLIAGLVAFLLRRIEGTAKAP